MRGVCGLCGKERRIWMSKKFGILICAGCNKDICDECGNLGQVALRRKNKVTCNNCFQRKRSENSKNYEQCSKCGFYKLVNKRDEFGNPICWICARQKGICSKCGQWKLIKVEKRQLCGACNEKRRRNQAILQKSKVLPM